MTLLLLCQRHLLACTRIMQKVWCVAIKESLRARMAFSGTIPKRKPVQCVAQRALAGQCSRSWSYCRTMRCLTFFLHG